MKENKNKIIIIVSISVVVVIVCAFFIFQELKNKLQIESTEEVAQEQEEVEPEVDTSDIKTTVSINQTADFNKDGLVILQSDGVNYVIDKEFKVLWTFDGFNDGQGFVDGYIRVQQDDKTVVYDKNGEEKFSYGEHDYERVELVSGGCLVITKKDDTYNSSSTKTGVYNIEKQEYVLQPSEEYVSKVQDKGDGMLCLDWSYKKYFNTKTEKIVEYQESFMDDFVDGYTIKGTTNSILVFDENGGMTEIKEPNGEVPGVYNYTNGMAFDVYNSTLFNLETKTAISLKSQFHDVDDDTLFENGYALVKFSNEGSTPYYTVIDKSGNMLFEPVKINNDNTVLDNGESMRVINSTLTDSYFIATVDENVTIYYYKNNKILEAQEGESFQGITNSCVKVRYDAPSRATEYYYKDMEGNRIQIKK